MASEIINEKEYTSKCDLWSISIIIYKLYFDNLSFSETTEAALIKSINDRNKLLKKAGNKELDDFILKYFKKHLKD